MMDWKFALPNMLLSGGAIGADYLWGKLAGKRGDKVVHFSFAEHSQKATVPKHTLHIIPQEDLNAVDGFLKQANKTLKRNFPPRSQFVANLLRRNYYQVAETDSVYVISKFEKGLVAGGTAWAVYMYLDRFDPECTLPCYVFDQVNAVWTQWIDGGFVEIDQPPEPTGTWTGIGSRDLLPSSNKVRDIFR